MAKISDEISDELRKWCESENGTGCGGFVTKKISDELREFADAEVLSAIEISDLKHMAKRIDNEMVELPKDADGVPIHVGDTVYGCRSGMKMTISELRMTADGWSISTSRGYLTDAELTHTRPDSLERIADELEGLSVDSMVGDIDLLSSCALDLAKRIRRLAAKDE